MLDLGKFCRIESAYLFPLFAVPFAVLNRYTHRLFNEFFKELFKAVVILAVGKSCRFAESHNLIKAVALDLLVVLGRLVSFPQGMEDIAVFIVLFNIVSD